ncbi:MAG TPA: NAD-dependent protein deacetylase [Trinickia sp.]|jgi:NAD-dependent SIR2 family protein deacetylase|nr:NAD-dependent protein deacetylase [Trinickia sp.]
MSESPASSLFPAAPPAAAAADNAAAAAVITGDINALRKFVAKHPRLFVLTGAGVSTGSGIPGYRDDNGDWMRAQPIQLQAFLGSEHARRRYWARSMVGWPVVAQALPNAAHRALAQLGEAGHVSQLVTQNVDGLHQRAGSAGVIELHGSIAGVTCLQCGAEHPRASIQQVLAHDNPALADAVAGNPVGGNPAAGVPVAAPSADGDAHLEWDALDTFRVPACPSCGGMLKPSVVFFGEGVPRARVDAALAALDAADAMLVVGSSLMVYSGYRFCLRAAQAGTPIAAVNLGRTRADALFALKIEAPCGDALTALANEMAGRPS